jgi:hypothetical protein
MHSRLNICEIYFDCGKQKATYCIFGFEVTENDFKWSDYVKFIPSNVNWFIFGYFHKSGLNNKYVNQF